MAINYQETADDLQTRINIHDAYGAHDIDKWMLSALPLLPNMAILDVGCGAGKQCFSYLANLNGKANITGAMFQKHCFKKQKRKIKNWGSHHLQKLDFNQPFPFTRIHLIWFRVSPSIMLKTSHSRSPEMHRVLKKTVTFLPQVPS